MGNQIAMWSKTCSWRDSDTNKKKGKTIKGHEKVVIILLKDRNFFHQAKALDTVMRRETKQIIKQVFLLFIKPINFSFSSYNIRFGSRRNCSYLFLLIKVSLF